MSSEMEQRTIGELPVEEFVSVLLSVLDRRKATGDPKLMEMSVKEFTDHMLERMKTRAYTTAQAEANVAERVLQDWQGLQQVGAVTQPFRVTNAKEAQEFGSSLAAFYTSGGKAEMVVAVAVVDAAGAYQKPGGIGL